MVRITSAVILKYGLNRESMTGVEGDGSNSVLSYSGLNRHKRHEFAHFSEANAFSACLLNYCLVS